ncbi:MAG: hypothetical protein RID15_14985 [Marinovum algicola]|jgi:hypothetical protein|uniref:Uncharacterized protein n=1 Tax=Marinovum algicola TaxID=42444 RepID=A0A975W772_9RHOB|nr:hypothetical protein [Marinovum algicola]SEI79382.1 hypothetical protein SAMN04487940_10262 [Marinovum algicola]SLN17612.1 hypothetical protein MAA5396_00452 [Marinovum algicola]
MLTSSLGLGGASSMPAAEQKTKEKQKAEKDKGPSENSQAKNKPAKAEPAPAQSTDSANAAAPVAEKPAVVVTQKVAPVAAIERPTDISQARAQALRVQAETQMNSLVDGLGQTPKSDLLAARETVAEDRPGALSTALKGYAKTASEPARASVGFDAVI